MGVGLKRHLSEDGQSLSNGIWSCSVEEIVAC